MRRDHTIAVEAGVEQSEQFCELLRTIRSPLQQEVAGSGLLYLGYDRVLTTDWPWKGSFSPARSGVQRGEACKHIRGRENLGLEMTPPTPVWE